MGLDEQSLRTKIESEVKASYGDLHQQTKKIHETELRERDEMIDKLKGKIGKQDETAIKEAVRSALEAAKVSEEEKIGKLNKRLEEDDIAMGRLRKKISELEASMSRQQPELKGEVGERDLLKILEKEFPDDKFQRAKRGQNAGDITQTIVTNSGKLETPIVYDNKESKNATKKDIDKAIGYKKIQHTNHVIIVSRNLPKKVVKSGRMGWKRGVMLLHPDLAPTVARVIREGLIEVSKFARSGVSRQAKESKLYDYIRGQEFTRLMRDFDEIHRELLGLQKDEEKGHQKLWDRRKNLVQSLADSHGAIDVKIASITQDTSLVASLTVNASRRKKLKVRA